MKQILRRIIRGGVILLVCACDPFMPLRVTSATQPTSKLELFIDGTGTLQSGNSATLSFSAYDAGDNVIDASKKSAKWTVSDEAVLSLTDGIEPGTMYAVGGKVGSTTVTVTVDGKTSNILVDVTPGSPVSVTLISGASQTGVVGDALPQPITVEAHDNYGNIVPSAFVLFTAPNGFLSSSFVTANAQGRASTNWTPSLTGNINLTARIQGYSSINIPQTVTTVAVSVTTPPTTVRNGLLMSPSTVVQLKYASNGANYAKSGVTISASAFGATLSGTLSTTTNATGAATFTNLTASGTAGAVTLNFSATAYGTLTSANLTLTGGTATKLSITTQPSTSVIAGQPFATAAVVQLLDAQNNPSPTPGVTVSATATNFTLGNPDVVTDALGKATFTALTIAGSSGQTFTLNFAAPTLGNAVTGTRTITGAPTKLFLTQAASAATCDATPTTVPAVRLQDASSNNVSFAGTTVTVAISGSGTIQAGGFATTDASGVATFSNLVIRGTTGTAYTLTFSSSGLTATTGTITGAAGTATALSIQTQPPATAQNGVALSINPVVRLVDICNNTATGSSASITATTTSGTVTFTNPTRSTSAGVATFTALSMAAKAQNYTLQFGATGFAPVSATQATALAIGAATELVITTEPPTTAQSDVAFTTSPVVRVRDIGGNNVPGARTVTAALASTPSINGTTVSATSSVVIAANDSTATFTGIKLKGIAGPYKLIFLSGALKPDTALANTTLGGSGTASQMVITTQPSTALARNSAFASVPVVQLRDVNGQDVLLPGVQITASQPNGVSFVNSQITTDNTGKATFTTLISSTGTTQPITPQPLQFSASGLTTVVAATSTALATAIPTGFVIAATGTAGAVSYYSQLVAAGKTQLVFSFSGQSAANVTLYGGRSDLPSAGANLCVGVMTQANIQTCTINNPVNANYFVAIVVGSGGLINSNITATQTP